MLKGKVDLLDATVAITSFFSTSVNPEKRWQWLLPQEQGHRGNMTS